MRAREMNSISCSPWLLVGTKYHFMLIRSTREHRTAFLIYSISSFPSYFPCPFSLWFPCWCVLLCSYFSCVSLCRKPLQLLFEKREIEILTSSVTVVLRPQYMFSQLRGLSSTPSSGFCLIFLTVRTTSKGCFPIVKFTW